MVSSDLDDPRTTDLRRNILARKAFLRRIYEEWYQFLVHSIPEPGGAVLELGSGAGFFQQHLPETLCSELLMVPGVNLVCAAQALPFGRNRLRAIVMTNVFHHIADVRGFLHQAAECVREGGVIAMVEPWLTPWSRLVYRCLHHEPCEPETSEWAFSSTGPLSGSNQALPWIVFERDRLAFEEEFPCWCIESIEPIMPIRYMLSGGFSGPSLMPGFAFPFWQRLEACLAWTHQWCGMFARILLRRERL